MAKTLLQELKESIRQRFNSRNKINIEKKANAVVKNLAKQKSGATYRKAYEKEYLKQVKLKARLDAQSIFKKKGETVKSKLDANLKEDIIKSVSPQPKKTNANVDLGYRSLY